MQIFTNRLAVLLLGVLIFTACTENSGSDSSHSFSHTQGVGSSANGFLSSTDFTQLIIEIDYVKGFKPSQNALDDLKTFLNARLNKPSGISIILDDEIPSPGNTTFTSQQVYELEKQHRNTFSMKNTIAAYFLVLDGAYEQENVLGIAYFNTSMALFEEVVQNNTGGFGQPTATTAESSVLMHEFGHILGLVNNGTDQIQDHEDMSHEAHCDVESCLMYYAIQTTDLMQNLMGGNVPTLDEQCIQDLKANSGK
tara:strand:- start:11430 stop:12188 length:759 start_codon:yes stop_codon:yes gene_type:complete